MRVYRVEHRDTGDGPYQGSRVPEVGRHQSLDRAGPWDPNSRIPAPETDGISIDDITGCHFGFASVEQASRWFHTVEVRTALADAGYVLSEYEMFAEDFVVHGRKQVAFNKQLATLIIQHPLLEVLRDVQEAEAAGPTVPGPEGPRIPAPERIRDPGSWDLAVGPGAVLERGGQGEDRPVQEGDEPSAERAAQKLQAVAEVVERQRQAVGYLARYALPPATFREVVEATFSEGEDGDGDADSSGGR